MIYFSNMIWCELGAIKPMVCLSSPFRKGHVTVLCQGLSGCNIVSFVTTELDESIVLSL